MISICFTGDSIMLTLPKEDYWNNNELMNIMKNCKFKSTNLEMVLSGGQAFASTFCGGDWMVADADRLDGLMRFDFDHYGMANNHTMDYSYEGLRLTHKLLNEKNLAFSGSGNSLKEATKATYVEKNGVTVAFISCTATCDDAARAGDESPSIPARPGVNMLRHSEILYLTEEYLSVIDQIAEDTCLNARFLKSVRMGIHSLSPEIHRLGRLQFVLGKKNEKKTICNKTDLARITEEVKKAKTQADYVFVGLHSHDIKGFTDDTPDDYAEEFAHACIDSGANAIIGTGTHQLKAVELYKGAPIFYSLGNFMFVSEHMDYAPADYYERYDEPITTDLDKIWIKRSKNNTIGLEFDKANYLSIVPILEFEEGRLNALQLKPIELGFSGECGKQKGYPYVAGKDDAEYILHRLNELSRPYGTELFLSKSGIQIKI